jgi:hypothetical protein
MPGAFPDSPCTCNDYSDNAIFDLLSHFETTNSTTTTAAATYTRAAATSTSTATATAAAATTATIKG